MFLALNGKYGRGVGDAPEKSPSMENLFQWPPEQSRCFRQLQFSMAIQYETTVIKQQVSLLKIVIIRAFTVTTFTDFTTVTPFNIVHVSTKLNALK